MHVTLSPVTRDDLIAYQALYEEAFPPAERKPLAYMLDGTHAAAFEALVISTPSRRVAGLCITVKNGDVVMLDYFAVSRELRGQGIGRMALPLIRERYKGTRFFLEIEAPPPVDSRDGCENPEQRVARKAFYASVGMVETGIHAFVYGCDMELLAFPESAATLTFEDYAALLSLTFPPSMYPERL